jgi:hypothetical protein
VVQVYIGAGQVPAGVQMAEKALAGFERIDLKKGQRKALHPCWVVVGRHPSAGRGHG